MSNCHQNVAYRDPASAIDLTKLNNRGPDCQNSLRKELTDSLSCSFYGTTLHFRGHLTPQPLVNDKGNILLWNGEIFGGIEVSSHENDGELLLEHLSSCVDDAGMLQTLAEIKGPWALVFYHASSGKLWFGRDVFGRRSLLCSKSADKSTVTFASVALNDKETWCEVPACGLYCCDLTINPLTYSLYPWIYPDSNNATIKITNCNEALLFNCNSDNVTLCGTSVTLGQSAARVNFSKLNQTLPSEERNEHLRELACQFKPSAEITLCDIERVVSEEQHNLAMDLIDRLSQAVRTRVTSQAQVCHRCMPDFIKQLQRDENVTECGDEVIHLGDEVLHLGDEVSQHGDEVFQCGEQVTPCGEETTQRGENVSNLSSSDHIKQTHSSCDEESTIVGTPTYSSYKTGHGALMSDDSVNTSGARTSYETYLKQFDVKKVGQAVPVSGASCVKCCHHARVAVLFSGGIDSLVIAALTHRYVTEDEPIDLLNVAFAQQPTRHNNQKGKGRPTVNTDIFGAPDRQTGRSGLSELQRLAPNRKWNFVEINISVDELREFRQRRVRGLVQPLNTVLDDSIGCAIWFAARGQGVITSDNHSVQYTTTARVVLVGMGADEQLVGYSRHRVKFNTSGWQGLTEEIKMEIERISSRNLGRDDRVISDHSREARFPFLDENVVDFLSKVEIFDKCNLWLPRGVGDKLLLRLAACKLGLTQGALLPKRAIQFGSRIAKAENSKEKASDICDRL